MTTWLDDLRTHDPCAEGYAWAKEHNIASLSEAFAKLDRGDWWLWLASSYDVDLDKPRLVTFAADCAERDLPIFEARYPEDLRPRKAIEAARAWIACPTPETSDAASAAYAASDAAASYAAYAASDAAHAAAHAAAYAADADAAYASYASYAAASADERRWQADRLRELFPEVMA